MVSASGCHWVYDVSAPLEAVVEDDRLAANPINSTDPTGLTTVTSPEWFPGSTQGPCGDYTMNVTDGSTSTKELPRITEDDVRKEELITADRLRAKEKNWGRRDRRAEGSFDTKYFNGVGTEREYYYVHGMDRIYADNEINYIGIGMYERWLGDYLWQARLITWAWKQQYPGPIPSGTWHWLERGYNDFPNMPAGPGGGPNADPGRERADLRRDRTR